MFSSQVNGRVSRRFSEDGFSLLETLLVVAILVTVSAIAIPIFGTVTGQAKADSAASTALGALQEARARAMAERRDFQLEFVAPNIIRVSRIMDGVATVVAETRLEGGQEFQLRSGVTPLAEFGATTAIHFTGPAPVRFTTDGSLIDANRDPVNATIHVAHDADADSSRAVTILGITGLMQTWRRTGAAWQE
jgi:prepilin-type N-terminal cleavage/methylation domain-containing protein